MIDFTQRGSSLSQPPAGRERLVGSQRSRLVAAYVIVVPSVPNAERRIPKEGLEGGLGVSLWLSAKQWSPSLGIIVVVAAAAAAAALSSSTSLSLYLSHALHIAVSTVFSNGPRSSREAAKLVAGIRPTS
ncbi:hypothetical protein CMEL01_04137 [Colletotrichum melonis]|uniref:Uncharacterized protein n=1 Tax=Colletotrichum melonis TaxID=1209925 RepID=A0AAI9XM14_9PEZI|nr:hypothetical protein CMEL01_04137 [Colletotrichum melonis]